MLLTRCSDLRNFTFMKRFGHLIRRTRQARGVSMDTLARRLGRSKTTLFRIETNQQDVPPELLPIITAELDIPPAKLRPDLARLMEAGG